jgi:hypothetical protein
MFSFGNVINKLKNTKAVPSIHLDSYFKRKRRIKLLLTNNKSA